MANKTYDMYCAVARALEILGERWTLLVIRELLTGPKRYADLQTGLPGIATNLLAERLRGLQDADVVTKRTLPPPAASVVYELTPRGHALKPVLAALGSWGLPLLGAPREGEQFRLSWLMIALDGQYQPVAEPVTVRLDIGGEALTIVADGPTHTVIEGSPDAPDLIIEAEPDTFLSWASGRISDADAIAAGVKTTKGQKGLHLLRRMYPAAVASNVVG